MGPWQKNIHIFLSLTPNEVKPTLTSMFRRALSVGVTFIVFWHTENDQYALALIQPPPRENGFPVIHFHKLLALSSGDFFRPKQATPSICITLMQ